MVPASVDYILLDEVGLGRSVLKDRKIPKIATPRPLAAFMLYRLLKGSARLSRLPFLASERPLCAGGFIALGTIHM